VDPVTRLPAARGRGSVTSQLDEQGLRGEDSHAATLADGKHVLRSPEGRIPTPHSIAQARMRSSAGAALSSSGVAAEA